MINSLRFVFYPNNLYICFVNYFYNMRNTGVISFGIKAPVIKEGDNLTKIAVDKLLEATANLNGGYDINDKDVFGITESVVARALGNYVTVDEVAEETKRLFGEDAEILLLQPIYSRNRFSMILKGIARAAKKIVFAVPSVDEVGNPLRVNRFTGVDMMEYYTEICKNENCEVVFVVDPSLMDVTSFNKMKNWLYCGLHDFEERRAQRERHASKGVNSYTLADYFPDKCEFGLLGSNKATEEKLKLFPQKELATAICLDIKEQIKKYTGKDVYVCIYGDGAFKDPVGEIWEFADPVTMPAFTDPDVFLSSPFELKLKAFADDKFDGLSGKELDEAMKAEIRDKHNNNDSMSREGTTPRVIRDLLASLMDLTSGSGDKGTPFVLVQGYFNNYATE